MSSRCTVGAVALSAGSNAVLTRGGEFQLLANRSLDFLANVFVFLKENAGVFTALPDTFSSVAEPSAGLFEDAFVDAEVDEVAFAGDAFAVKNVKFSFAEGCSDFVFHDFGAGARTDDAIALLDGLDAANIDAHGGVEFERTATGGGFRVAEHDTNFF